MNNAKIMSSLDINHWIHQNSTLHNTRSRRHKKQTQKKGTSQSPSPLARALFRLVQVSKNFSWSFHFFSNQSQNSIKSQISHSSLHSLVSHILFGQFECPKRKLVFEFRATCHGHTSHVRQQTTRS